MTYDSAGTRRFARAHAGRVCTVLGRRDGDIAGVLVSTSVRAAEYQRAGFEVVESTGLVTLLVGPRSLLARAVPTVELRVRVAAVPAGCFPVAVEFSGVVTVWHLWRAGGPPGNERTSALPA